ncbi:MAG: hypothetical protein EKK48_09065 [Candidatus Melainabacteria bacterium]|nr:MAG: hypothetical protein EKK48_09065 [Candidatus Melainabacteria bacterium]
MITFALEIEVRISYRLGSSRLYIYRLKPTSLFTSSPTAIQAATTSVAGRLFECTQKSTAHATASNPISLE